MTYDFETSVRESVALATSLGRTAEWAEYVVTSDPFAGDFGDGSERTLEDRLVVAKRGGPCRGFDGPCERGVAKGDLVRVIRKVDSDGFFGGRLCPACLDADWRETQDEDAGEDETP